jgi:CO/xanthine dehydrogenase FAD-binding subunit
MVRRELRTHLLIDAIAGASRFSLHRFATPTKPIDLLWNGRTMKAASFEYSRPESLEQVLEGLSKSGGDTRIIAGGQSLVAMMAMRLARPECLIDINHVAQLDGIEIGHGAVTIRAGTRQAVAGKSAIIAREVPLLSAALPLVGHIQTRNRGTIGGSLAHGDPTAEILLTAIALGARVTLASLAGTRVLDIADFSVGPMMTQARDDECLTEIDFPIPPGHLVIGVGVDEISPRAGDYAIIGAAAQIGLDDDGICRHVRLAVSGASPVPVSAPAVASALAGTGLDGGDIDEAVLLLDPLLDPESDVQASAAYRRRVAPGMLARVIKAARDQARSLLP